MTKPNSTAVNVAELERLIHELGVCEKCLHLAMPVVHP